MLRAARPLTRPPPSLQNARARPHIRTQEGFEFLFDNKLLTVFSCSNYCGVMDNKGAFVIFERDLVPHVVQYEARPKEKMPRLRMRHAALTGDVISKLIARIAQNVGRLACRVAREADPAALAQRLALLDYYQRRDARGEGLITRREWAEGLRAVLQLSIPFLEFQVRACARESERSSSSLTAARRRPTWGCPSWAAGATTTGASTTPPSSTAIACRSLRPRSARKGSRSSRRRSRSRRVRRPSCSASTATNARVAVRSARTRGGVRARRGEACADAQRAEAPSLLERLIEVLHRNQFELETLFLYFDINGDGLSPSPSAPRSWLRALTPPSAIDRASAQA